MLSCDGVTAEAPPDSAQSLSCCMGPSRSHHSLCACPHLPLSVSPPHHQFADPGCFKLWPPFPGQHGLSGMPIAVVQLWLTAPHSSSGPDADSPFFAVVAMGIIPNLQTEHAFWQAAMHYKAPPYESIAQSTMSGKDDCGADTNEPVQGGAARRCSLQTSAAGAGGSAIKVNAC